MSSAAKGLGSCFVTAVRLCFVLQLQLFSIESKPEALINLRYCVARMSSGVAFSFEQG